MGHAERAEHAGLDLGIMDPDGSAAKLGSVEHDVVGDGTRLTGRTLDFVEVVGIGHCERMMFCVVAPVLFRIFEEWKVGYPEKFIVVRVEQAEALCALDAQRAERIEYDGVFVRADQDQIAVGGAEAFCDCCVFFGR